MTDSAPSALVANDVGFRYGERVALDGVSFTVGAGTTHAFLGPNGSGKSTLFKILATAYPLPRGSVQVFGRDLTTARAELRRELGVVFQSPALDRKLTVRENLVYAGRIHGLGGADLARRIDALLAETGLADRAGERVATLSGGWKRRTELAKGMLHRPRLLLLDEPSAGLDPNARRDLWSLLRTFVGVTVLFTTHLMEEAEHANAVTLLDGGRIVAAGSPAQLKQSLGGEVLDVTTTDPDVVARWLRAETGAEPHVFGSIVRVHHAGGGGGTSGGNLVERILQTHRAHVERVAIGPPSLEDVFVRHTGRRFEGGS